MGSRTPTSPGNWTPKGSELDSGGCGVRQPFNDTEADQLWLVVGAPPEAANTREMSDEQLRALYPDGPKALPPELG